MGPRGTPRTKKKNQPSSRSFARTWTTVGFCAWRNFPNLTIHNNDCWWRRNTEEESCWWRTSSRHRVVSTTCDGFRADLLRIVTINNKKKNVRLRSGVLFKIPHRFHIGCWRKNKTRRPLITAPQLTTLRRPPARPPLDYRAVLLLFWRFWKINFSSNTSREIGFRLSSVPTRGENSAARTGKFWFSREISLRTIIDVRRYRFSGKVTRFENRHDCDFSRETPVVDAHVVRWKRIELASRHPLSSFRFPHRFRRKFIRRPFSDENPLCPLRIFFVRHSPPSSLVRSASRKYDCRIYSDFLLCRLLVFLAEHRSSRLRARFFLVFFFFFNFSFLKRTRLRSFADGSGFRSESRSFSVRKMSARTLA